MKTKTKIIKFQFYLKCKQKKQILSIKLNLKKNKIT